MGKTKSPPGMPKWLQAKPDDAKKTLIKDKVYPYLSNLALQGEELQSSTKRIPGFIEHLAEDDPDFGKIKASHMKTTYAFIEALRVEIKNSIAKINKEIKEGKLLPDTGKNEEKSASDNQSQ